MSKDLSAKRLVDIMARLRSKEDGCPWDIEQTHASIRKNLLEETYEACEAIDLGDMSLLKEELGDILLQVVFHSRIAEESGDFNFGDVVDAISDKLVYRHPHIFSDTKADTSAQVLDNWEQLKQKEKGFKAPSEYLESVPRTLPALMRTQKLIGRATKSGMYDSDVSKTLDTLADTLTALKSSKDCESGADKEKALATLLFETVGLCRFFEVDSEEALSKFTTDFVNRFKQEESKSN